MLFEIENLEYEAEGRSILGKRSLSVEAGQHVLLLGSFRLRQDNAYECDGGFVEAILRRCKI